MYKNSNSVISGTDSKKAKSEKKDCVVKAIASSTNVDYDTAHSWVKENFEREDKKGTSNWMISKRFKNQDMEIGGKKFKVSKCKSWEVTNTYKLYGELINRQKTVKSFRKDKPNGTYMVLVSKHAFTIKEGTLIDNHGEEWRPTRKVIGAYKFSPVSKEVQLSLDFS